jgi:hypothetical protein
VVSDKARSDLRPILVACTFALLPKPAAQTAVFEVSWTSALDPKETFKTDRNLTYKAPDFSVADDHLRPIGKQ